MTHRKHGWEILSWNLMDIECNFLNSSKVNGKCFYKGKFRGKCLILAVEFKMCDYIYIGNTKQIFNKIMYVHFSDVQWFLKKGPKSDLFASHYQQQFKSNT